jgi:hypothetical protein
VLTDMVDGESIRMIQAGSVSFLLESDQAFMVTGQAGRQTLDRGVTS